MELTVRESAALTWPTDEQGRFWSRVDRSNGCWVWTGSKSADGYGRFYSGGILLFAHRISAVLGGLGLTGGLVIDHLCRNRACCNPGHLEPVTHRENTLRGEGITARHAKQTHCSKGHPLEGENLYSYDGGRSCRTCRLKASDRYRDKIGWRPQQCAGISAKSGKPCTRRTADESGFCYAHRSQAEVMHQKAA